MERLELRRNIGQLMVFGFDGTSASEEIKRMIREDHLGSIILFGRNIGTPEEVLALTTELQEEARQAGHDRPLLICTDQENGIVRRLGEGTTQFPGAMLLGATGNPRNAFEIGKATARELKALGINWNLAPVLDVNNNPSNPVIGVRSFGESAEAVSMFGKEAMKGMQEEGVVTTLKHFPGHGDTHVDSHLNLPTIPHAIERLLQLELKPFIDSIKAGADTVMTAHIYFSALTEQEGKPATLAHEVLTGLLRNTLGFDGVVTTDCMEMKAIADTVGVARGGVEALKAGADLIMVSHHLDLQNDTIDAIVDAVERGEVSLARIEEALDRLNRLKDRYVSWDKLPESITDVVGCNSHRELSDQICREGITVVRNQNILPLSKDRRVLVIYPINQNIFQVEDRKYASYSLGKAVQEVDPNADEYQVPLLLTEQGQSEVLEKAKQYEVIIFGTLSAVPGNSQHLLLSRIHEAGIPVIVVGMRSPYEAAFLPEVPAYLATYEFSYPTLVMAAKAIFGEEHPTGKLPITLPEFKEMG